jgi:hypothetical protein
MSQHADRQGGVAVGQPGKIACLLSGNFSLHEVMPDRSLRTVRAPRAESPYARLSEVMGEMERYACPN